MHICFVALNSYNLFAACSDITHVGGAEMQQYMMARWLIEAGHDVTVITRDHGQPDIEIVDGIRIVKAYDVNKGLPGLRFFAPRWTRLIAALGKADADIYYQRGASLETGQVAAWCRKHNKVFVFAAASESDCDPALPFLSKPRERFLYKRGLKLASAVVVQSQQQVRMLESAYGIAGTLIRSSGRILGEPVPPAEKSNRVIWLGRFSPQKRFEWVLEIAASCSNYEFLILGASNDGSPYAKEMLQRAAAVPNVKLVGHVSKSHVVDYYNQAKCLILTSPLEGFPNVFLEAWQLGIPVISSFDPDAVVATHRLGWIIESPADAIDRLRQLDAGEYDLDATAARVRRYFAENHTTDGNMPLYIDLFRRLLTDPPQT